jgi:DNA-binding transcriptional LysR family regulator
VEPNAADGLSAEVQPMTGRRFARSLDWNLLKVFHEIVQAAGISEAARQMSRKQPALSMALRRLEEHLGTRLCQRGPGGFALTQEGEALADLCETFYDSVRGIPSHLAHMAEELRGRVRIQLISNLIDPSIDRAIESFHHAHEGVEIFVSVTTWDVIRRSVLRNAVEIGIGPAHHKDPQLRYELLFREIYRPYCGQNHPLFGRTLKSPKDLAGEAILLTGADEPDELTRFRMRYNLGRHVAGLSEHLEEASRLAILGVGICFLPEAFVSSDVEDGKLHPVLARGKDPASDIFLISNPGAPIHRARDTLLDHFRQRFEGN